MPTVIQHDNPRGEKILTMEQLTIAMEVSGHNTVPDEVETVDPEDIDGPGYLDLTNDG